ncbi:site-2 protease family protein [Gallaecimonas sp. GXIMD4217]|uniref:metalloprotease n=1 Tax=Gallaecimonas sp. GXIMD4217 TaxID=3131927 RepID=UPI00311ABF5C
MKLTLLDMTVFGHQLRLEADIYGKEYVYLNDQLVSEKRNLTSTASSHPFAFGEGDWQLEFKLDWRMTQLDYRIQRGDEQTQGQLLLPPDLSQSLGNARAQQAPARRSGLIGWAALGFKLFKSAKVIKVALAGASFASYAYLFNWQMAVILLAILVFHEYGHLKAMHRFGIKTKGIFLIPFFGGAAVASERFRTQWQEVYVALAGPSFGMAMCLAAYGLYLLTGSAFIGAVASLAAFLNLFNLLPIHPLDGGRVLKAIMASTQSRLAFWAVMACSAAGFAASLTFGLSLLAILLVVGVLDLLGERKHPGRQLPMNGYAMLVSLAWYLAVALPLLAIIFAMAGSGLPGTEIPHLILTS